MQGITDKATSPSTAAREPSPSEQFARWAWLTLAVNLLVIVWGAFVRASGSGAGCGSHWPLCNGEVVPRSPAAATLIELTHRLSSAVALLFVVVLVAGAFRRFSRGHPVRRAAVWSTVFMLSEALIGAGLVLLELVAQNTSAARGYWVGAHLVNTLLLVASLTLTAWWAGATAPAVASRDRAARAAIAVALLGVLLLSVSGAVTALGDTLFPAASFAEGKAQTFSPDAHLFVRLRIWHPTLALVVGVAVLAAALTHLRAAGSRPARLFALAAAGLYALQLAVGLANMWWLAPVPLQLVHLLLADLVWIALVLLAAASERRPQAAAPITVG